MLRPLDILIGILVPLIWGLGIVFAKAAIEHFPPIMLMSLRFAVTALALVWFVKPPRALMGRLFAIAFISAAVQYSLTFTGLKGIDASTAALVVQLEVPFLMILGVLFLGEKPGWRRSLGVLIAFVGVAIIFGEPKVGHAWGSLGLVIAGAFVWAVGQMMVRQLGRTDALAVTAWVAVFAAPQLAVFSYLFEEDHLQQLRDADWVVWGTVLYLGLIMTALGYRLWYGLIGREPLQRVAPFLLLLPVFSVAGGILLLGESLTQRIAAGGSLVIVGVASIVIERPSGGKSQPTKERA